MLGRRIRSLAFTAIATCFFATGGYAANAHIPAEADTVPASLATDIQASLVVCDRGPRFVSSFGHCSIRMSCPSAGLDNYYTYLIHNEFSNVRMFFTHGVSRGHYAVQKWDEFSRDYVDQDRTITEYPLNLTTDEVRRLWMNLDREVYKPLSRMYSFLHSQCASISADIIQHSLDNEHIRYLTLDPAMCGTERDFALRSTERYPWYQFVFMCLLGREGEQPGKQTEMLTPTLIAPAWTQAVIENAAGDSRPVFASEPRTLYAGTYTPPVHSPFTPTVVFTLLLVLAIGLSIANRKGHLLQVGRVVDGCLLAVQTLVGCLVVYLCFFSHATWGPGNALLPVFNPLPLLLWLCFRRRPWFRWLCLAYALVVCVMIVASFFIPQLNLAHALLFALLMERVHNGWWMQRPAAPADK